jgi:hypothetical protein
MALHSQILLKDAASSKRPPANGDLRRHRRVPLELTGRFMRANRSEYACTLKDISVGGALVTSEHTVDVGERIIAYFEHLGGLEGKVTRLFASGYAFQFKVSEHKREKLAAQIMWLLNRNEFPDESSRQHERVASTGRIAALRFDDGMIIDVELLDLSASGASVRTPARPAIGEEVVIAKIRSVVRRHHPDGIGLQFLDVQDQAALRTNFP